MSCPGMGSCGGLIDPRHDRLIVLLEGFTPRRMEQMSKPLKRVTLQRYVLRDEVTGMSSQVWVPPVDDYTEKEISLMVKACEKAGIKFQRRFYLPRKRPE